MRNVAAAAATAAAAAESAAFITRDSLDRHVSPEMTMHDIKYVARLTVGSVWTAAARDLGAGGGAGGAAFTADSDVLSAAAAVAASAAAVASVAVL